MNNIMAYKSNITYKELCPIMRDLSSIRYSIIKGEALSIAAYNSVGQRTSSDVDILVPKNELHIFEDKLKEHGFKTNCSVSTIDQRINHVLMMSCSHQTQPYYKHKGAFVLNIDLNFDVFWGEYKGKRFDIYDFLSDSIETDIYGVKVKILHPLKAMIQLVLHHYKDMNSIFLLATRKSIKYEMFKDVFYLLKNNAQSISIENLYNICREYGIIPYTYYILYYTGLLFEDNFLKQYISAFRTSEGEALLNCYGLNETERHVWKYDFVTRLESESLYELIKNDLTDEDIKKILINKKVFRSEQYE